MTDREQQLLDRLQAARVIEQTAWKAAIKADQSGDYMRIAAAHKAYADAAHRLVDIRDAVTDE